MSALRKMILGETWALPAGVVRLYKADADGNRHGQGRGILLRRADERPEVEDAADAQCQSRQRQLEQDGNDHKPSGGPLEDFHAAIVG